MDTVIYLGEGVVAAKKPLQLTVTTWDYLGLGTLNQRPWTATITAVRGPHPAKSGTLSGGWFTLQYIAPTVQSGGWFTLQYIAGVVL